MGLVLERALAPDLARPADTTTADGAARAPTAPARAPTARHHDDTRPRRCSPTSRQRPATTATVTPRCRAATATAVELEVLVAAAALDTSGSNLARDPGRAPPSRGSAASGRGNVIGSAAPPTSRPPRNTSTSAPAATTVASGGSATVPAPTSGSENAATRASITAGAAGDTQATAVTDDELHHAHRHISGPGWKHGNTAPRPPPPPNASRHLLSLCPVYVQVSENYLAAKFTPRSF